MPAAAARPVLARRWGLVLAGTEWSLLVWIGRPGQRLCTTAHALEPQVMADAGTLHITAAAVATLAMTRNQCDSLHRRNPPDDLILERRGRPKPCPVISLGLIPQSHSATPSARCKRGRRSVAKRVSKGCMCNGDRCDISPRELCSTSQGDAHGRDSQPVCRPGATSVYRKNNNSLRSELPPPAALTPSPRCDAATFPGQRTCGPTTAK